MKFLALFLLIPLLEVVMFIKVGVEIGALWTIFLTLGTAITGSLLIRLQGLKTFHAAKTQLAQGQVPASAMVEATYADVSLASEGSFTGFGNGPRLRRQDTCGQSSDRYEFGKNWP